MAAIPGNLLPFNTESVETDATGWAVNTNCTIAQSTLHPVNGTHSLAVTATAAGNAEISVASQVAVTAGKQYLAYVSAWSASALVAAFDVDWYTAGSVYISSSFIGDGGSQVFGTPSYQAPSYLLTAGAETQFGLIVTSPATAAFAVINPGVTATAASQVVYLDEFYFGPALIGAGSSLLPPPGVPWQFRPHAAPGEPFTPWLPLSYHSPAVPVGPTLTAAYQVNDDSSGLAPLTSPAFSPQVGEVIVVKAWTSGNAQFGVPSDSAGYCAWQQLSAVDVPGFGTASVWMASAGSPTLLIPPPPSMAVTVPMTGTGAPHGMVVERWAGAMLAQKTGLVGYSGTVDAENGTGAPSGCSLTPATHNSVVTWLNIDVNAVPGTNRAYVAAGNVSSATTETGYHQAGSSFTAYSAYQFPQSKAVTESYGLTAPTGQQWQTIAVELEAIVAPTWNPPAPYQLSFYDDFPGASLNLAKWQPGWYGSGITGPVNTLETALYSTANVAVSNGNLQLTCTAVSSDGGTHPNTGALVATQGPAQAQDGLFDYQFGFVEWRANIPGASGQMWNWPALWCTGYGLWPTTGEFDVAEVLSGQVAWHTINAQTNPPGPGNPGGNGLPGVDYSGWHTYGMAWLPASVSFYYDGQLVGTVPQSVTSPTNSPVFLVMDNTTGANGSIQVLPTTMLVDWVRVWSVFGPQPPSGVPAGALAVQGGGPAGGPPLQFDPHNAPGQAFTPWLPFNHDSPAVSATVALTTPNLALAAPLLTSSASAAVALTAPNVALAAPNVAPAAGQVVALTTPNLALAAPLLAPSGSSTVALTAPNVTLGALVVTPSAGQVVALTTPNVALAAPAVAPAAGKTVALTTPNIALAAPLLTPSGSSAVALTAPNVTLAAPLLAPPAPVFPDPSGQLGVRLELNAGGTWVNVTGDLDHGAMTIGRGHPDESAVVAPSTFSAPLRNAAARYSPDNVMSDLWPWCVQNMPVRASIPAAQNYLRLEANTADRAFVNDTASLHITGSLEVRTALRLSDWQGCALAARFDNTTPSWYWLLLPDGTMRFGWADSGGTQRSAASDVALPFVSGDFALKVTLDVTTATVTFYTSASIDGTYAQLGSAQTFGIATTVASGNAPLVAGYSFSGYTGLPATQLLGRVYELRLYNGIGGTVAADGVFSAQAAGTTTWTDSASNTWNLAANAQVSDREYRGYFEASEWPQEEPEYNPDAANDTSVPTAALVPLAGGGLLRRLSQRAPDVQSAMYRAVLAQPGLAAYWPMEDAAGSSQFASAVGGLPMGWTGGPPVLANSTVFAASAALPTTGGAQVGGGVPAYTGGTQWSVRFLADVPTLPGASQVLAQVCTTASVAPYIALIVNSDGTVTLTAFAADGVTVAATTGPMSWAGGVQTPLLWSIEAVASGGNVQYSVVSVAPGASTGAFGTVTTAATGAAGYVGLVLVPPFSGVWADVTVGHVHVQSSWVNVFTLGSALAAHLAEPAGTRFARLCADNGIQCRIRGNAADTTLMGVQPAGTLVTLLQACADADQGVWTELRQQLGWGYVTRKALYSQPATASLSYLSDHLSMWTMPPVRDDKDIANDVTVANDSGSTARMYAAAGQPITGGRMSTAPTLSGGTGTYAQTYSVSVASDSQLPDLAGWKLHLGTVDQARLPGIVIDLANAGAAAIYNAVVALDLGDRLVIASPPRRLGFEPVTQLAQALTETLGYDTLTIAVAGVPELPYQVWQQSSRVAPNAAVIASGVNTTATSWSVKADANDSTQLFSTSAGDYPADYVIDGERTTWTAVSGSSSPQTATVTRSVNGVVKSHLANAAVTLWPPPVIGL